MKRLLPAAAALALAATSVLAADLPHYKAPYLPPPPPPPMRTGFYVGLNAGGAWSSSNSVTTSGFPLLNPLVGVNMPVQPGNNVNFIPEIPIGSMAALSASGVRSGSSNGGFIGGGQIGYNWQFYNSFVAGIEADIQGIASNNSAVTGFGAAANPIDSYSGFSPTMTIQQIRRSVDYLGTVRGRLGWLFTPTLLVYSSGGLAYGGLNLSANFLTANLGPGFGAGFCSSCLFGPSFGNGSYSDTRVGWTAGGGLEWMLRNTDERPPSVSSKRKPGSRRAFSLRHSPATHGRGPFFSLVPSAPERSVTGHEFVGENDHPDEHDDNGGKAKKLEGLSVSHISDSEDISCEQM